MWLCKTDHHVRQLRHSQGRVEKENEVKWRMWNVKGNRFVKRATSQIKFSCAHPHMKTPEASLVYRMVLFCVYFSTFYYILFNMTKHTEMSLHCHKNFGLDISHIWERSFSSCDTLGVFVHLSSLRRWFDFFVWVSLPIQVLFQTIEYCRATATEPWKKGCLWEQNSPCNYFCSKKPS